MKLIPEQISYLRKEEETTKKNLEQYENYLASRDITSSELSTGALIGDSITDHQLNMERQHYKEITDLLANSEYVTARTTDKIDIGTKFVIQYDDDDEQASMTLTECVFKLSSLRDFISIESPIGKAVIGKKAGEEFKAEVITGANSNDRRIISGRVVEIKSDPNDYLHFIREKSYRYRICRAAKQKQSDILSTPGEASIKEYQKRQEITESQKRLLTIEADKLARKANTSYTISRLAYIRKLLATAQIATPPTDGTIGVGSTFDVVITDGETSETKHLELVNRAVSEELEDAYIERIDALGLRLYGLRENDVVKFRKNNKYYQAAVLNIEQTNQQTDNNQYSATYQYTKK